MQLSMYASPSPDGVAQIWYSKVGVSAVWHKIAPQALNCLCTPDAKCSIGPENVHTARCPRLAFFHSRRRWVASAGPAYGGTWEGCLPLRLLLLTRRMHRHVQMAPAASRGCVRSIEPPLWEDERMPCPCIAGELSASDTKNGGRQLKARMLCLCQLQRIHPVPILPTPGAQHKRVTVHAVW